MLTALHARAPARSPSKALPKVQSITKLYAEFKKAHAIFFRLNQQYKAAPEVRAIVAGTATTDNFSKAWHKRFEAIVHNCNRIANELVQSPATSSDEVKLKFRIINWKNSRPRSYRNLEQFDKWSTDVVEETEAANVLASLQADFMRISAAN
jgi:hypothetical protein